MKYIDNVRDDVFTLAKVFNEYDSINIIFFQLSTYGGEQLIRIDFNPNTLKEFDGRKVWRQLMYFARLNSLTVRLSRFDLAFDIFNRPEIVNLQHFKGGVTHKVFYGRGGELETKILGVLTVVMYKLGYMIRIKKSLLTSAKRS